MSAEDGRVFDLQRITSMIERMEGDLPDLFTIANLTCLFNQDLVRKIIEGGTPMSLKPLDEQKGIIELTPIFTVPQLTTIRTNLATEFDVNIPSTEIITDTQVIQLPPQPTETGVLGTSGQIEARFEVYEISEDQTAYPFSDIFDPPPDENSQ